MILLAKKVDAEKNIDVIDPFTDEIIAHSACWNKRTC